MTRENLYVAATRARHRTTLYVVTHELPGPDPDDNLDRARTDPRMHAAREILTAILARETAGKSATETITDTLAAGSLTELAPRFQHALEIAVRPAYKKILRDHYGDDRAGTLAQAPGYAQLRRALLAGEQAGHHPARLLARAATSHDPQASALPDDQLIEQLTTRITTHLRRPAGRDPRHLAATPAWLTTPASAAAALSPGIPGYLRDLSDVIAARVTALTDLAAATRPAWTRAFGALPSAPADQAAWKACLATVAAYRDQHAVTDGEARHILGPRPEPGTSDETAWQHATAAITTARRLAARTPPAAANGAQGGYGRPHQLSYGVASQAQPAGRRDLAARSQPSQGHQGTVPPLLQPPPPEPRQHGRQIGS